MRQIINTNKTALTFPKLDMSFASEEIKKVSDEVFAVLIQNAWIQEIKAEKEKINIKGRKKH